ncbi:MAG: tetratricopeptide repeat protein [Acidobacteria bacterium]|nr:tetratricopeptide repeat protein [Acidobacteriota bacterium]
MASQQRKFILISSVALLVIGAVRLLPVAVAHDPRLAALVAKVEEIKKVLASDPENVEALSNLGENYYLLGEFGDSVKAWQEAVRLSPTNAGYRAKLGRALFDSGDPDAAITHYLEAIRLEAGQAVFHSNLGIAYAKKGDFQAAAEPLREALRLRPDDWSAREILTGIFLKTSQRDAAFHIIHEGVQLDRNAYIVGFAPNASREDRGEFERASPETLAGFFLAMYFRSLAETDKMVRELEELIRQDQNFALPHILLADAYGTQGKRTQALARAQQAVGLNPNLPAAHFVLANAYYETHEFEAALGSIHKAIVLDPANDYYKKRRNDFENARRVSGDR